LSPCSLFAIDFLCFQYFLASFAKTRGWVPPELLALIRSPAFRGFGVA
jgi:hypothetical protein